MRSRADTSGTPTMAYFAELGRAIKATWSGAQFDPLALPEIAMTALAAAPPAAAVDPLTLLELVATTPEFLNMGSSDAFGDAAIPVFLDPRLHIEVLFWFDGAMGIHDHGFAGAFHVLSGSSIHSHYTFDVTEAVSPEFQYGHTRLQRIESLRAGDTRGILPANQFIHALFHLDQPSTTIVIRTHTSRAYLPTRVYLPPHIAVDGGYGTRPLMLRRRALAAAAVMAPDRLGDLVFESASAQDPAALYCILKTYLAVEHRPDRLHDLLDRLRVRDGARIDLFRPVFDREVWAAEVIRARAATREPAHRFFLALLLNCPSRHALLELTAARYPAEAPSTTVVRWLDELSHVPTHAPATPNLLGFAFEPDHAAAATRYLRDEPAGPGDAPALAQLRASRCIRPLFSA
jgi:hypothetical protein